MSGNLDFIIPVYNPDLKLLEKCVQSLVTQSLKDWYAIFVMDGKNAEAEEVIRSAMKKCSNHFKIIEVEHGGAPKARNAGALHSTGDYLIFWDCDSQIEPDAAKNWLKIFKEEPEIGFIYSGYRFLDEQGCLESEPFDPWLLRVRNYISTCFPLRRKFLVKWNEDLKSLQDWDFWLSVVEKGANGKYLRGYAFATAYPTGKSISGQGCTPEAWLERVDAVKKAHNLPERDVCVTSMAKKTEAIWLAKLINADYQDAPHLKPHRYKTIVHLGLSFLPGYIEHHAEALSQNVRHVVFYTCDDLTDMTTKLNLRAVWKYSELLNNRAYKQFVEDREAAVQLKKAGFNVEVMPLPMAVPETMPEGRKQDKPAFAIEVNENYAGIFNFVQASMPDVDLVMLDGASKIEDYSGLVHFHPDKTISATMKKFVINGLPVISNVQAPFMGRIDDSQDLCHFIPRLVNKIRESVGTKAKPSAVDYYKKLASPEKLLNVIA